MDGAVRGPRIPFGCLANNTITRAAVNYSIVDDFYQSPMAMFALEVLKTCPTQRKALLATLGDLDPSDSRLIAFDLENAEPKMPSTITFKILVSIRNVVVYQCILYDGESTCVMYILV